MNTLQELLRDLYVSHGISHIQEAADRIDALEAENFALAAGQCPEVVGDEGGTPRCKRISALEAERDAVLRYCRDVQESGTVNERIVARTVAGMLVTARSKT